MVKILSIGEFSKISTVTKNTLRYYDEIDLIKPIHTNAQNGYRYYDVSQLKDILLVKKLKMYSFSLEEVAEVLKISHDDSLLLTMMNKKKYIIKEKLKSFDNVLNNLEKDIFNLERGVHIMDYLNDIEIKLVETKTKNILYIREKISVQGFEDFFGKLYKKIVVEKLTPTEPPFTIYHDEEFSPQDFDCEIAIPVKEVTKATREFKGRLCAMSVLKGPYSELSSTYSKLTQWIEDNNYKIISSPYEIYLSHPEETPDENLETEVYFPIEKL